MSAKEKYKLIDVFAGMGCASLGFRKAGFQIAGAVEIDPLRCEIYEKNLKVRPVTTDIMKMDGERIMSHAGIKRGEKFCVVGCPPCQSFSKLSDTSSVDTASDPRSRYVGKFGQIIEDAKPAAAVFENVAWMARGPGKAFFERYLGRLRRAGYVTEFNVVNAADYGVPQNRRRVIAISVKKNLVTRDARQNLRRFLRRQRREHATVRSAIKDLMPIRSGSADPGDPLHCARNHSPKVLQMISAVPKDGGSRARLPSHLWLQCHKKLSHGADTVYSRMWWDRPSPTLTCRCTTPACGRFIHPTQNRGITIREAMRLQTIPDNFKVSGASVQKTEEMIGDAVPVTFARTIGSKLLQVVP